MGLGIAQVCASGGFETILYDVSAEQIARALKAINDSLSFSVSKGKIDEGEKLRILARIKSCFSISDLKADLIIEAAVERLDVKKQLFAKLEQINGGNAILATNTSSISVSDIASDLQDPSSCIGLHFFNPADRMKLVEIISGKLTRTTLPEILKGLAISLGKIPVFAKDSPGFIVNRVARHFYVESLNLLEQESATIESIDALLRSSGLRMGPFELMDLIGVDTNLAVTTSVYEGFGKAHKFKPSKIQQELVEKGYYGRKTGKGFYDYSDKEGN
jgi:3-hydroxybutyryl-CoA dehydrogenase